jgi:capsular polysaccharide biosynthesis protein
MIEEVKKKYTFYDYLFFMWKKKLWLLAIPLIMMVIAVAISFLQKPIYEGTALFNVGDSNDDQVTVPDLIVAKYRILVPADIRSSLEVIVPKYKQVKVKLSGTNKQEVSTAFTYVVTSYQKDLDKVFQRHVNLTKQYVDSLQEQVTTLEKLKKTVKLSGANNQNLDAFINLETELSTRQEQLQINKMGLESYNKSVMVTPNSINELTITEKSSPLKANLVIALLLGLVIAVIVVTLWKYILDAKIHQNQQQ